MFHFYFNTAPCKGGELSIEQPLRTLCYFASNNDTTSTTTYEEAQALCTEMNAQSTLAIINNKQTYEKILSYVLLQYNTAPSAEKWGQLALGGEYDVS